MAAQRLLINVGLLLLETLCVQSRCAGFTCSDGTCLTLASQRCDSQTQCPDQSDERSCSDCRLGYPCENGQCTFLANRCNDQNDCSDNSDEFNCNNSAVSVDVTTPSSQSRNVGLITGVTVAAFLTVAIPIAACVTITCIVYCAAFKPKKSSVHPMPSRNVTITPVSSKAVTNTGKSSHPASSAHQQNSQSYVQASNSQSQHSSNQIKLYHSLKSHSGSAPEKRSQEENPKLSGASEQSFPKIIEVHPAPASSVIMSQLSVNKTLSRSSQSGSHHPAESQSSLKS